MRIGIYAPFLDPRPTGLGVYIDQMVREVRNGVDAATIYTETPENVPPSWGRVDVVTMPSRRVPSGPRRNLARQAWAQGVLPACLVRDSVDLLFVPFHDGCLAPTRPQVVVVHDLTPLVVPSGYFNPLLARHMRHVLPRVLHRSSGIVAVSENTRNDLQRILGISRDRVSVIPGGYDHETFRPRTADEAKEVARRYSLHRRFILYAGTYAGHKNARILGPVLARLVQEGHDIELALCGRADAGEFHGFTEELRELGLLARTHMLGYVSATDLSSLMCAADAFLYPSLYEGFGLGPLEAMASGGVVVATTAASVPEVVGDGGVLLSPYEPMLWSSAISRILRDPGRSAGLRTAAVERASAFGWSSAGAAMLAQMERIVRGRGRRSRLSSGLK